MRAARFWLLLSLAVLVFFCAVEAHAQAYPNCEDPTKTLYVESCADRGSAYRGALMIAGVKLQQTHGQSVASHTYWTDAPACSGAWCTVQANVTGVGGAVSSGSRQWPKGMECPLGMEWSPSNDVCDCLPGSTYRPDGTCKSCESMNSEPGFGGTEVVRGFKERCLGGCTFRAKPMASTCMSVGAAGQFSCTGEWEFTGASCSVSGGDPPMLESPVPGEPGAQKPTQECTPAGSGQTVCIKENGQHCYTASTGKQICWAPGQVGEKGDGPVAQVRKPGTETPLPSSMQTHAGDALTSQGEPMTVTTVVNGQLTVTTTTQNYVTQNGTDAKLDNSGQPADGTDDKPQDGSASGGESCESRPVVSDPALEMIANQAWATRCAVEEGNAAKVTGDVGDCKAPFTVEGSNANAEKLRAMRAQICGPEAREEAARSEAEGISGALESDADAMEAETNGQSIFAEAGTGQGLSSTRFGVGGSCPQFSIDTPVGTFNAPPVFCDIVAALRVLFMMVATVWGLMRIREA